jgi:hypothetical protein
VEKQGMNDQSHSFLSRTIQHEDCDVDLHYLSEESDVSLSESDPDDDVAIANAEAELATMVAPVHQGSGVIDLNIGCLFEDKKLIRFSVLSAASNVGRRVYVKKQQPKVVLYLCKGEGCQFRARFSLTQQHWKLTVFNEEHTCIPASTVLSKSEVLHPVIERALLLDPSMKPAALQAYVETSLNVNVTRHWVNAVKRTVLFNSGDEQAKLFNRLPAIVNHPTVKGPEGHLILEKDNNNMFSKLFISPSFAKSCFENSKPVIGIDGAHTRNRIAQVLWQLLKMATTPSW